MIEIYDDDPFLPDNLREWYVQEDEGEPDESDCN